MDLIKKIFVFFICLINFCLLFNSEAQAFLAPSSLAIITASFIPQLIAIVISVLLIAISFLKKYKKIFILTFCVFAILVVLSALSFLRIKKINQEKRNFIWAKYKESYSKDTTNDLWVKMLDSFENMEDYLSVLENLEDTNPDLLQEGGDSLRRANVPFRLLHLHIGPVVGHR